MPHYYVNDKAQQNGDHEVHTDTCRYRPNLLGGTDLGKHLSCQSAVEEAKKRGYKQVNGCYYCSRECHTQ
ncbi:MAG: hypothetical protein EP298_02210 [Gammaproteobacteria bacterium]|nr:MAG: hypothetical protein EP298_02210 [Gammaproteobacteria bacterium]UTW43620.1 hypothetical protein KFE69_05895 [bacterium SCSIO 12844]